MNIRPERINWALSQTQEEKLGDKLMNNITKWLDGTKMPTFNQIADFSKKANIPPEETVTARKAIDCNKIGQNIYDQVAQRLGGMEW